ncbi:MAG: OmpA family protein [Planctomycetes bacterium]|nr:OmpA family protein [Planctomycetota bacterium]
MRSRNVLAAMVFAASALVFAGCTPQDDVAYVEDENARLKQLLIQYENDARNTQVMLAEANGRVERANLELDAANRKIGVYESEIPRLREIAANAANANQFASTGRGMSEKVAQQLSALAEQFGGVVVGNRLELPGDFFFDSGRYELNNHAKAAVRSMAEILAGENLFLMVVGYTDNDPVRNPNLRSKGINDNLHLSLLRAKSVVDELKRAGYPPTMMYPTGWGELRPIVPNTDRASKKLNRRVDILIDPAASNIFGMSTITGVEPIAMR